jgi:uncharacterized protein (DUF433 family)
MTVLERQAEHIGVGLYSFPEAAQIVGEPTSTLRRWARPGDALVPRKLDPSEQTLTFVELMEMHFIKMFRDQGVSLQTIRRASRTARTRFRTDYPFSVKRFDTDGRTIFATLKGKTRSTVLIEDLEKGQYVFEKILRPFFRKLDYRNQEIARYWPCSRHGRIVLDPARKFGKPIDAETGVPTSSIVDALSAGGGQPPEVVARWLGIPIAAVTAAVRFERSLRS